MGIQASAHLKLPRKKSGQNSPGIFLTVASNRKHLATNLHTKNKLNSKYTQGKFKVFGGVL